MLHVKNWRSVGLRYGIILGLLIFLINIVLTFIYLNPVWNSVVSYTTVPLIILFTGFAGYSSTQVNKKMQFAIKSSILTVIVGLSIGFTSLFIMTSLFIDIVSNNPVLVQDFQKSGQQNIHQFIIDKNVQSVFSSVPISLIISIISGTIGGLNGKKTGTSTILQRIKSSA